MRLTALEVQALNEAVKQFQPGDFSLRLYGSRVDDSKRGGDIDLLLIVSSGEVNSLLSQKHLILAAMKTGIGDQKIDLAISDESRIQSDPFLQLAFQESIDITLLH